MFLKKIFLTLLAIIISIFEILELSLIFDVFSESTTNVSIFIPIVFFLMIGNMLFFVWKGDNLKGNIWMRICIPFLLPLLLIGIVSIIYVPDNRQSSIAEVCVAAIFIIIFHINKNKKINL
jgi:peptidoglycan/LPS O-acetylase OafA/YrhL